MQGVLVFDNDPKMSKKSPSHLFCIRSNKNNGLYPEVCGALYRCERAIQESPWVNITGHCHRGFFFFLAGCHAAVFVERVRRRDIILAAALSGQGSVNPFLPFPLINDSGFIQTVAFRSTFTADSYSIFYSFPRTYN